MNKRIIKINSNARNVVKPQKRVVNIQKPSFVKKDPVKLQEIKDGIMEAGLSNPRNSSIFRENRNSNSVFIVSEKCNQEFNLNGLEVITAKTGLNCRYFIATDYCYVNEKSGYIQDLNSSGASTVFVITTSPDKKSGINTHHLPHFKHIINSPTKVDEHGFSTGLENFVNCGLADACAIQLAIILGYQKIYLLGFEPDKSYEYELMSRSISLYKYKNNIKGCSTLNKMVDYVDFDIAKQETEMEKANNNLSDLIVVGYYTAHTPYEHDAQNLINSCKNLSLNHHIVPVQNLGSWQENTRFKAQFMLNMLTTYTGKRLLYVDCDAVFNNTPDLFINYSADVAVRYQDFAWKKNECLSGTIYMENNLKTRKLCEKWIEQNQKDPNKTKNLEQWNLGKAIEDMVKSDGLVCKNLPPEYTFIFDSMRKIYPDLKPVIEHFQASRKYKRII